MEIDTKLGITIITFVIFSGFLTLVKGERTGGYAVIFWSSVFATGVFLAL